MDTRHPPVARPREPERPPRARGDFAAETLAQHRAHTPHTPPSRRTIAALAFAALGIVFGDIGTSPLYALRACFSTTQGGVAPTPENVLGILSLVFWSLILVVSVEYLTFITRADNRGEGGILALLALATATREESSRTRGVLVALGLFGTALLYGDGMITPAISVLGAMEGLEHKEPALAPYVVPLAVAVLVALFLLQRRGTAGLAALFSPITLVWFVSIAVLGLAEIVQRPDVLAAANPVHAVRFFAANGFAGLLALGFVFLVVTGSEALYADMGHLGRTPIRIAWFGIVLPALLLNYFGQGALLLENPSARENPFYSLVPEPLLYPMIGLATAATVVASQALISGAYSLTRQALQLGFVPRMTIVHTSGEQEGQIYVPSVNTLLMLASVGLVIGFRESERLASAYGIAVVTTMIITTIVFNVVARHRLGWSPLKAGLVTTVFLTINLSFFAANVVKVAHGGWFPILMGIAIYLLMVTWRDGRRILQRIGQRVALPLEMVLEDVQRRKLPRVPGLAVFMNADPEGAPLVLLHHLKHNKLLHEHVVLLSIVTEQVPFVPPDDRVETRKLEAGFFQLTARYGFMEQPSAPQALALSEPLREVYRAGETTYYLGRQTLIPTGRSGMARWRKKLFRFMQRNARSATAYFGIPPNRVVELGAQVQF